MGKECRVWVFWCGGMEVSKLSASPIIGVGKGENGEQVLFIYGEAASCTEHPPKMRQGGGRYNQGGYIERSEYRQWFSVWGIAAN